MALTVAEAVRNTSSVKLEPLPHAGVVPSVVTTTYDAEPTACTVTNPGNDPSAAKVSRAAMVGSAGVGSGVVVGAS
eukprot:1481568-Rhodomonas_salina.1